LRLPSGALFGGNVAEKPDRFDEAVGTGLAGHVLEI
jgi:hypothetical protein